MKEKTKEAAFEVGYQVRLNRKPITDCPFYPGKGMVDSWRSGWLDADAKILRGDLEIVR